MGNVSPGELHLPFRYLTSILPSADHVAPVSLRSEKRERGSLGFTESAK